MKPLYFTFFFLAAIFNISANEALSLCVDGQGAFRGRTIYISRSNSFDTSLYLIVTNHSKTSRSFIYWCMGPPLTMWVSAVNEKGANENFKFTVLHGGSGINVPVTLEANQSAVLPGTISPNDIPPRLLELIQKNPLPPSLKASIAVEAGLVSPKGRPIPLFAKPREMYLQLLN